MLLLLLACADPEPSPCHAACQAVFIECPGLGVDERVSSGSWERCVAECDYVDSWGPGGAPLVDEWVSCVGDTLGDPVDASACPEVSPTCGRTICDDTETCGDWWRTQ